jgi:hypothetical protein
MHDHIYDLSFFFRKKQNCHQLHELIFKKKGSWKHFSGIHDIFIN